MKPYTQEAWLRIVQSFALLPLGSAINRVPTMSHLHVVVAKALRRFPQFDNLAVFLNLKRLLAGYILLVLNPNLTLFLYYGVVWEP